MSQPRMEPKPTADHKVKKCLNLFDHRKGRVKTDSSNVRILKAKQETKEREKTCEKSESCCAIMKILVLCVQ